MIKNFAAEFFCGGLFYLEMVARVNVFSKVLFSLWLVHVMC